MAKTARLSLLRSFAIQRKFMGALKGKWQANDRLIAILSVYEALLDDPLVPGGCPILNTAVESDDTHPALRDRARQAMDGWRSLFSRIVQRGISSRGELAATTDAASVTTILIATIEGAVLLSNLYGDMTYMHQALQHLKGYIQQLAHDR
jgi:hypothetical protein